jgi:hypothetical protein
MVVLPYDILFTKLKKIVVKDHTKKNNVTFNLNGLLVT